MKRWTLPSHALYFVILLNFFSHWFTKNSICNSFFFHLRLSNEVSRQSYMQNQYPICHQNSLKRDPTCSNLACFFNVLTLLKAINFLINTADAIMQHDFMVADAVQNINVNKMKIELGMISFKETSMMVLSWMKVTNLSLCAESSEHSKCRELIRKFEKCHILSVQVVLIWPFVKVAEHSFRALLLMWFSVRTRIAKTKMLSIERSFYLCKTHTFCAIFLYY